AGRAFVLVGILLPPVMLLLAWRLAQPGIERLVVAALAGLVLFIFVGVGFVIVRVVDRVRLELDDEGVTYYQLSFAIRARWTDVERVGLVPSGMVYVEGLILRQSEVSGSRLGARLV